MKLKALAVLALSLIAITLSFGEGNKEITGPQEITVITHRTDLVDNLFKDYVEQFNKIHPDIIVNYESITDYEGEIKIRMNTDQYGDLLMIPKSNFPVSEYPDFFEPLGTVSEMSNKYEFTTDTAFEGNVYGISSVGNAQGIIYNKEVFKAAGINKIPATPEDFLAALNLIKAKTDSIPYYTNYAAGWPMGGQWEAQAPNISGDPKWYSHSLPHMDSPWTPGEPYYVMSKLLWDMVEMELIEDDPTTTDWEACKGMLAKGEIATMVLGSWSIIQMQQTAESLGIDPGVIGYMPFPYTVNGNVFTSVGSDFQFGINVNSKNKEAARIYLDWFTEDSGFVAHESGIPVIKGAAFPEALAAFDELGVKFIQNTPAPAGEEALLDSIDAEAEIGRWSEAYRMRILEAAIGNRDESFEDIINELNAKWNKARKTLGVK